MFGLFFQTCRQQAVENSELIEVRIHSPKKFPRLGKDIYKEGIKLGKGAFGEVFRGVKNDDRSYVAIKEMSKEKAYREQIQDEVALLESIDMCKSTNLLHFVGAYEDAGSFYMVSEYADGGDLDDKIKEIGKSFNAQREQGYACDIISAIHSLHSAKIIHRDIKPHNFLVSRSVSSSEEAAPRMYGTLKLCDFGLAVDCSGIRGSELSDHCGTPHYMAPEVILAKERGSTYSYPVDIWGAGLCLHSLLKCGAHPFAKGGGVDYEKLKEGYVCKVRGPLKQRMKELRGKTSETDPKEALKELFRSFLHKDPLQRPTSEDVVRKQLWKPAKFRTEKAREKTCPKGHDLQHYIDTTGDGNTCDCCGQEIQPLTPLFRCSACDFDHCQLCYKA
jgi:serine/threonine protein kinase